MKLLLTLALAAPIAFGGCRHEPNLVSLVQVRSELEANKLLSALELCGVAGADKHESRLGKERAWTVVVPRRDLIAAERVRLEFGLPRDETDEGDGEGAFPGLESPQRELERSVRAAERKLERALEAHPRVAVASVHLPVRRLTFSGERAADGALGASVLVRYLPNAASEAPLVERDVQRLVAPVLEGLEPAGVEVVLQAIELPARAVEVATEPKVARSSPSRFELYFSAALTALVLACLGAWWHQRRRAQIAPVAKGA